MRKHIYLWYLTHFLTTCAKRPGRVDRASGWQEERVSHGVPNVIFLCTYLPHQPLTLAVHLLHTTIKRASQRCRAPISRNPHDARGRVCHSVPHNPRSFVRWRRALSAEYMLVCAHVDVRRLTALRLQREFGNYSRRVSKPFLQL